MFDPVYRQIRFETDEAGRPAGKYPDIPHGICITEQGTAVVCFEAPEAVSVEAALDGKEFPKTQERSGKTRILDRGNPQHHAGIP